MTTARATSLLLALIAVSAASLVRADPDPIRDYPASLGNNSDFFLGDILSTPPTNTGNGGVIHAANINTFPGLSTQGVSYAYLTLKPNGQHLQHWHPRASELIHVIQGTIRVTWVDTKGKLFDKVLSVRESAIVPRGLVHTIRNVGDGESVNISGFNSENPGTQVSSTSLFSYPVELLTAPLQVSKHAAAALAKNANANGITPAHDPPSNSGRRHV